MSLTKSKLRWSVIHCLPSSNLSLSPIIHSVSIPSTIVAPSAVPPPNIPAEWPVINRQHRISYQAITSENSPTTCINVGRFTHFMRIDDANLSLNFSPWGDYKRREVSLRRLPPILCVKLSDMLLAEYNAIHTSLRDWLEFILSPCMLSVLVPGKFHHLRRRTLVVKPTLSQNEKPLEEEAVFGSPQCNESISHRGLKHTFVHTIYSALLL